MLQAITAHYASREFSDEAQPRRDRALRERFEPEAGCGHGLPTGCNALRLGFRGSVRPQKGRHLLTTLEQRKSADAVPSEDPVPRYGAWLNNLDV